MDDLMTLAGHSSATSGISLARKARLRPLASHTRLMAEAAASCTAHWPNAAESAAIDSSWSKIRRDAYPSAMARMDGTESRFDSRPDVRRLVEQVVAKMRDLRAAMSTLAASGSPEQQAVAITAQKRAEDLLRQVSVTAIAAMQS